MSIGFFLVLGVTFMLGAIACVIECNNMNYTPDSGIRYVEEPSQDLVIDLSGVYIQSECVRDTINPVLNDCLYDNSYCIV